ncbi:MAG TPA: type II toxin-antitoxin system VapC family toxin [Patescibacteria group bacterium]|nr:type II toxin-antitoxin system VapC family toxin [Patescibacteria group bacterium]
MTIDTNIIVAYLNGDQQVIETLSEWRNERRPLFLSTVVEAEVLSFPNLTSRERYLAEEFLEENFTSIPVDRAVARLAANIRQTTKIKFPDAAIAATALFTHSPLVTRNVKDFKKVKELQYITI